MPPASANDLLIPEEELNRLRHCHHHNPHGFYGWHATADGSVIRTRQIGAEKVELILGDTQIVMNPIGDDIFAIKLGNREALDYRLRVTWPGQDPVVTADPYIFLSTLR